MNALKKTKLSNRPKISPSEAQCLYASNDCFTVGGGGGDPSPNTFEALFCLNQDNMKKKNPALFSSKKKCLVGVQENRGGSQGRLDKVQLLADLFPVWLPLAIYDSVTKEATPSTFLSCVVWFRILQMEGKRFFLLLSIHQKKWCSRFNNRLLRAWPALKTMTKL